jgi:enolase
MAGTSRKTRAARVAKTSRSVDGAFPAATRQKGAFLEKGWVIANHIFMSVHAAFLFPYYIERILASAGVTVTVNILPQSFLVEVVTGLAYAFATFYVAVGWHERGHYLEAVRQITLNNKFLPAAQKRAKQGFFGRLVWNTEMLLRIPMGKFHGINKFGLTYSVDSPYNLAVKAAGPRASRNLFWFSLPFAGVLLVLGFTTSTVGLLYLGRIFLGISVVGLLDFIFADAGEYKKFMASLKPAPPVAKEGVTEGRWIDRVIKVKQQMVTTRLQEMTADHIKIRAPWGFRNCAMGGAHTEKEYPESNISMQEGMFIPLSAENYEEAQRMTVQIQYRLKEIIERTPGCRVMGIGLEGGLATFITKDPGDIVPEQKMWRLMKQTIEALGYEPGVHVAVALDPAPSQLQDAHNIAKYGDSPEAREKWEVGTYRFWRYTDQEVVMNRNEILDLYEKAIAEGVPIVSIEDGFAENDYEGWRLIEAKLGDKLFIIGDDLVTTNDATIEKCIEMKLINTVLIKANQIGTLSETILAMLTALGHGMELVVSHRSKSPNDDMEAQIGIAAEAMGLKAGGGANTERLVKYGSIIKLMKDLFEETLGKGKGAKARTQAGASRHASPELSPGELDEFIKELTVTHITAYEEATNAGIPTVGVKVTAGIAGNQRLEKILSFTGSTPLGTSAGTGEAIHLVDSMIFPSRFTKNHPDLFKRTDDGTYRFAKDVDDEAIAAKDDAELKEAWTRAKRYEGKGCLNAVDNVENLLADLFVGKKVTDLDGIASIDRVLLQAELKATQDMGLLNSASASERTSRIAVMQRKGTLGMNAILSLSLALARLSAAINGKDLWSGIREQMQETMAKAIAANGGMKVLPSELAQGVRLRDDQELWQALKEQLSFDELKQGLQALTRSKPEEVMLHELLRQQLPVYEVEVLAST